MPGVRPEKEVFMTDEAYLRQIDAVIERGPYAPEWSSLTRHPVPAWYRGAKLGVFLHWGVYSVPAFGNEWYPRSMYDPNSREYRHHREVYGDQKTFGYKDFIPLFTAERFDPDAWAALFREAGVRYVMPVAEHHDGFAMYETHFNRWNAKAMGPRRDVVRELREACARQGLRFCASTHRAEHYFFHNMGKLIESDVSDPTFADLYGPAYYSPAFDSSRLGQTTEDPFAEGPSEAWLRDWFLRTCELIDLHRPSVLYFDWWIQNRAFKPYLKRLAAYYYNRAAEWGEEVTINYKHEAFPPGAATFDVERGALTGISPLYWQTDTAVGRRSWGYTTDNEYKGTRQIITDLIDIVSKNGNLLINVGPKPDGTITEEETAVLRALGAWLRVNGEGIYDATFWKTFGEGEVNAEEGFFKDGDEKPYTEADFRFTYKDGALYAFQMRPAPAARIRALRRKGSRDFLIENVRLLGSDAPVRAERTAEALELIPTQPPQGDLPVCYRIGIS